MGRVFLFPDDGSRVLCYQPSCHRSFQIEIVFESVASEMLLLR